MSQQNITIVNNHHPRQTFTPFSAIDRFLGAHTQPQILNYFPHHQEPPISPNGYISSFVSSFPNINNYHENVGGINWPSGQDVIFLDGSGAQHGNFIDGSETRNLDTNLTIMNQEVETKKRKVKGGYPSHFIKGQWTDEEDRKLKMLVSENGERKWAQIAEKMFGRAGKQCRERWHNHLRPDIKKHSWNAEEERMLITAHQKLGNKWADIAKEIPGRSENSIKNHWNATKRKQKSRRIKSKKNDTSDGTNDNNEPQQISPLQHYIRTKSLEEPTNNNNYNPSSSSNISTPLNSSTTISDDQSLKFGIRLPQSPSEVATSLIAATPEDEQNFMRNFFHIDNFMVKDPTSVDGGNRVLYSDSNKDANNIEHFPKDVALDNMMKPPADDCFSFLFDGSYTSTLALNDFDAGFNHELDVDYQQMNSQASSSGTSRNDMDLMDMVLASKFYNGSKSANFVV